MSTTTIYQAMKKFTDARADARDAYLAAMAEIKDAKGSKYYSDRERDAAKVRQDIVEIAAKECRAALAAEFSAMRDRNHARTMTPPSEDQLRLLQLLQMRESLTSEELQTAANAMQGNGAALAMVQELARKHGVLRDFRGDADEFSIQQADDEINNLAARCRKLMESAANHNRLMEARRSLNLHGVPYNEDQLPQEPLFDSEDQFEQYMGYGDRLKAATE